MLSDAIVIISLLYFFFSCCSFCWRWILFNNFSNQCSDAVYFFRPFCLFLISNKIITNFYNNTSTPTFNKTITSSDRSSYRIFLTYVRCSPRPWSICTYGPRFIFTIISTNPIRIFVIPMFLFFSTKIFYKNKIVKGFIFVKISYVF